MGVGSPQHSWRGNAYIHFPTFLGRSILPLNPVIHVSHNVEIRQSLKFTPVCPRYLESYEEIRQATYVLDSKLHRGSESALGLVVLVASRSLAFGAA